MLPKLRQDGIIALQSGDKGVEQLRHRDAGLARYRAKLSGGLGRQLKVAVAGGSRSLGISPPPANRREHARPSFPGQVRVHPDID